jgi:hypothetical protein
MWIVVAAPIVVAVKLRDQRGQTGTEYLGALLLVAVVIFALTTTGAGAKIAGHAERIVCQVAGGDCKAAPPTDAQQPGTPQEGPDDGPPIPNGPLVVLPFPGTYSATCTAASKKGEGGCKGPKGNGVFVSAQAETTFDRSPTKLDGKGCPVQTVSLSTKLKLEGTGTGKGKTAGGKLSVFTAGQSKYAITVPPDQADAIARGDRQAPNPLDPRTILPGESVVLSEEFYAGHNLQAEYRALQVALGYEEGRRVSSGALRVDPKTVRIYVGDEDFVRQAVSIGLGAKGAKVSIGNTKELSDGKLRAIDVDISTPEGWNAYQQFVASGKLPEKGVAGTSNPTSSKTLKYTDATKAEIEVGNKKIGGLLADSEGNVTETVDENGWTERSFNARYRDVGIEIVTKETKDGLPVAEPVYAINAEGVDANAYASFQKANDKRGADLELPPGGNVRLEFSRQDLDDIKEHALNTLAFQAEQAGVHPRPSTDEIARALKEHPGELRINGVFITSQHPETLIGGAQSREEVLAALYYASGGGDGSVLFNELAAMISRAALANGDIRKHDENSYVPHTVAKPDCKR